MATKGKQTRPSVAEVKLDDSLNDLYGYCMSDQFELQELYELHKYHGFTREATLVELFQKFPEKRIQAEIILICALNGPKKATNVVCKETKRTLLQMGIPASRKPGVEGLSCGRISASTADLAAFFLKRMNHPQRFSSELPGWLQFPTAGAIKLPERLRVLHKEYARAFSERLPNGSFNMDIYQSMELNSYLDPRLNLF
jgi:hypothetical protein